MSDSFVCLECGQSSDYGVKLLHRPSQTCMTCTFIHGGPSLPARLPDEDQLDAEAEYLMRLRQMRTLLDCAMTAIAQLGAWPWEGACSPVAAMAIQDATVAACRARNLLDNDIVRAARRFPLLPPARSSGH